MSTEEKQIHFEEDGAAEIISVNAVVGKEVEDNRKFNINLQKGYDVTVYVYDHEGKEIGKHYHSNM